MKIVLPGKKSRTLEGQLTVGELKARGLIPKEYSLARKDPETQAVQQLKDEDLVGANDLVYGVPRHIQGGR